MDRSQKNHAVLLLEIFHVEIGLNIILVEACQPKLCLFLNFKENNFQVH